MVKIVKAVTYQTEDGRLFDTHSEAILYEKHITLTKLLTEHLRFFDGNVIETIVSVIFKCDEEIAEILGINIDRC